MRRFLAPILLFVLAIMYYTLQACPTYYFWDSAELTAAVAAGGVPHPPGFPLLLLVSGLWVAVLPMNLAYALNIFSAFFGALGLTLWYLVIARSLSRIEPRFRQFQIELFSMLAVLAMAVSLSFSIQAVRFEVYTLNFAGFAALVLVALKIVETPDRPICWDILFFALVGLFLGAHNLTIILALPGILLLVLRRGGIRFRRLLIGLAGSLILSGLLYLAIYIRAKGDPSLNWGDPSNLSRFIDYILIRGFSVSSGRFNLEHFIDQFKFVFIVLNGQLGLPAIGMAIYGAIALFRARFALALPLLIVFLLNTLSVTFAENYFYENYDLHGYLVISLAVMIVFMAAGFLFLSRFIYSKMAKPGKALGLLPRILPAIIAVLFLIIPVSMNFLSADLSRVRTAQTFAREFLSGAPSDAIVITSSYNTYFCSLAEQAVNDDQGGRPVLSLYNWDHKWGREATNRRFGINIDTGNSRQGYYRDFLNHFLKNRPIYVEYDPSSAPIAHLLRPRGLGYVLALSDTTSIQESEITRYESSALSSGELESVRTWVLWFQNRGEYFEQRGDQGRAMEYFAVVESLATRVVIK